MTYNFCLLFCLIIKVILETQWDAITHTLEWLKWKRLTILSVGKDLERPEFPYFAGGNAKWYKWYNFFRRQFVVSYKLEHALAMQPSIPLLGGQVSSLSFTVRSQWQLLALPWPKAISSCSWVSIMISDLISYGHIWVQYSLVLLGTSSHTQSSEFEFLEDFHLS